MPPSTLDATLAPARPARRLPRALVLGLGGALVFASAFAIFSLYDYERLLSAILAASVLAMVAAFEGWGFRSLKTGILLLGLVGVGCIYGTMFYAANQTLGDHAIPLAKVRVFNSWWFFLLLGVFFVQFLMSTWPVTKMSFRTWGRREFRRSRESFRPGPGAAAIPVDDPEQVLPMLRARFTRAHRDGDAFFAHKGLCQRWGPTIVHSGIVLILVAGLVRIVMDRNGLIMSEGRFIANEGEVLDYIYEPIHMDQAVSAFNIQQRPMGSKSRVGPDDVPPPPTHQVKVLDFDEIKHANSASPAYFSTHLQIKDLATGEVRVAKLDMNHSVTIGPWEFHQASYAPMPPRFWRTDFDVRDAVTGERLAVTDASPDTRVQVGDLDLFLEVDGEEAGAGWRLYTSAAPEQPVATGALLARTEPSTLSIRPVEFYLNFALRRDEAGNLEPHDDTPLPITVESAFGNPAARVEVLRDGQKEGEAFLFFLEELAAEMPRLDERVDVRFTDFRVARKDGAIDINNPDEALMLATLVDRESGEVLLEQAVGIGMATTAVAPAREGPVMEPPPAGAEYAVYPMGQSTRFTTVLTVVSEPVVPYYIAGVVLIFIGALMTFMTRYQSLHALLDREAGLLYIAARQRFGRVDADAFGRLVDALSGGRGAVPFPENTPAPANDNQARELAPA